MRSARVYQVCRSLSSYFSSQALIRDRGKRVPLVTNECENKYPPEVLIGESAADENKCIRAAQKSVIIESYEGRTRNYDALCARLSRPSAVSGAVSRPISAWSISGALS